MTGDGLLGKIIALQDNIIGRVVGLDNGIYTVADTKGNLHHVGIYDLGYGRERKKAALISIYGKRCLSCGQTRDLSIDHIKGHYAGNGLENLQILCRDCNGDSRKKARGDDFRPFHPSILFEAK